MQGLTGARAGRFERIRRRDGDPRSFEEIRTHYEIERELSDRLRRSTRDERRLLYRELYDEAYRRIPRHPTLKSDPGRRASSVRNQMGLLRPFLRPGIVFLEIGPGSGCALSLEVAKVARTVIALDVSARLAAVEGAPANLEMRVFDGCTVDVPAGSVDVAFSNQVMEHLHPDDLPEQLRDIHRALAPGGVYVFTVPNRLSGPSDVSKYFDEDATGFHLREYTFGEVGALLKAAGFSRARALLGGAGRHLANPLPAVAWAEGLVGALPGKLGRAIAGRRPVRNLLAIKVVAFK